jgi:hypothetical protein
MEESFEKYQHDDIGISAMKNSLGEFQKAFKKSSLSLDRALKKSGLISWDKARVSRIKNDDYNITEETFNDFKSAYNNLYNLANNAKMEKMQSSLEKVEVFGENLISLPNKLHVYNKFFIDEIFPKAIKKLIKTKSKGTEQNQYFLKKVERQYCVHSNDIIQFIISNPTILFSWFDERFEYSYDKEKINLVSPFFVWDSSKNNKAKSYHNGKRPKKVQFKDKELLLGHSLSIIEDSICLLYDLGRAKRMEGLFDSKLNIYLTAADWATFNRSANIFYPIKEERDEHLEICLKKRVRLYEELRIHYDIFHNYGNDEKYKRVKNNQLLKKAFELKDKSIDYGYVDNMNNKGIEDLISTLHEKLRNNEEKNKSDLYIIYSTLKHFHALDFHTIVYTLIQRNTEEHYYKKSLKYIKLAVESEFKFDNSFCKMDYYEGKRDNKNCVIYYKHYYFVNEYNEVSKNPIPQNVIPYTTTAGRVGLGLKDIEEVKEKVILLSDFKNKDKISSIVEKMDLKQIAIQMSDLFSFCNYFFSKDSVFWRLLFERLNKFDGGDCATSWDNYSKKKEGFMKYIFTPIFDTLDYIPYYFYPFIYEIYINKAKSDDRPYEERLFRALFADVVAIVLDNVDKKMNYNN